MDVNVYFSKVSIYQSCTVNNVFHRLTYKPRPRLRLTTTAHRYPTYQSSNTTPAGPLRQLWCCIHLIHVNWLLFLLSRCCGRTEPPSNITELSFCFSYHPQHSPIYAHRRICRYPQRLLPSPQSPSFTAAISWTTVVLARAMRHVLLLAVHCTPRQPSDWQTASIHPIIHSIPKPNSEQSCSGWMTVAAPRLLMLLLQFSRTISIANGFVKILTGFNCTSHQHTKRCNILGEF